MAREHWPKDWTALYDLRALTLMSTFMRYLAYGSNLHPLRLSLRVPNSRLVGTTKLDGCRLTFHKRSNDGSSKCNLDFTGDPNHLAHAAVYEIPRAEMHLLDRAEGVGSGYFKQQMMIELNDESLLVFVYLASQSHVAENLEPYDWYKGFVLAGAHKHQFPPEYLQQIAAIASKPDINESRRITMQNLLVQLED
ncbi:gamma-glutamylcyclotransferase family protein [Rhodanobacter umsongensis]